MMLSRVISHLRTSRRNEGKPEQFKPKVGPAYSTVNIFSIRTGFCTIMILLTSLSHDLVFYVLLGKKIAIPFKEKHT